MNGTVILIGAFVICALLYVMRRRARLGKED